MKKKIYIISHSSMDLASVLNLYQRCSAECDVVIIVSSTAESMQFLEGLGLPKAAVRFLNFASRGNWNKKRLGKYLHQLLAEKRVLDGLAAEVSANHDNEVFFHSYDNDPHAGYLVSRVARTNTVTLVDVLGIRPKALKISDLLTKTGSKNIIYLAIVSAVFGKLFILSGRRSYPVLSLDLKRVNITEGSEDIRGAMGALAKYKYRISDISDDCKNVVFLYSDSFQVCGEKHASINREIVECLARNKLNIYIKTHPQSQVPAFLADYGVRCIPKHVPFELVDLTKVSLVVGLAGAPLLCTGGVPTVSILRLVYQEDSDQYKTAMVQLSQNPTIMFVSSVDELEEIVGRLG
jgi:hypothetical protein